MMMHVATNCDDVYRLGFCSCSCIFANSLGGLHSVPALLFLRLVHQLVGWLLGWMPVPRNELDTIMILLILLLFIHYIL